MEQRKKPKAPVRSDPKEEKKKVIVEPLPKRKVLATCQRPSNCA